MWVPFLYWNSVQIVPRRTEEPPEQHQRHTDQQPQYKKSKRYTNLHHVKYGRAEAAQDTGENEGPECHAGVERELGQHKGVLSTAVAHIRVQCLMLREKCRYPNRKLEQTGEEDDDAADLHGLQLIMGASGKFMRELVGERQAAHEGQGERVEEAHEARGLCHMQEERVMNEPKQADSGEGTEVGQVLGTILLKRSDKAVVKLFLHHRRIRYVVFTV